MFSKEQLEFLGDFSADTISDLEDEISDYEDIFEDEEKLAELKEDEFIFESVTESYEELKYNIKNLKEILEIVRKERLQLLKS